MAWVFVENQFESVLSWSVAHCAYELVSWPSFHRPINMLPSMACQFGTLERRLGQRPGILDCVTYANRTIHSFSFIGERVYNHAGLVIFDMGGCCSPSRQSGS